MSQDEVGWQTAREICANIDRAIAEHVVPDARGLTKIFRERLQQLRGKSERDIVAEQKACALNIERFSNRSEGIVAAALAVWNEVITKAGIRDLVDDYIERKLTPVIDAMFEGVRLEAASALASLHTMIDEHRPQ